MKSHRPSELPACITSALVDRRGENIRRAIDRLAVMMTELHGFPCHITVGADFSFALIIRDLSKDGEEAVQ